MALRLGNDKEWVAQSEIRSMTIACARVNGINLAQGVCDLSTPPTVLAGAREAMDDGINSYTRYDGLEALRKAVAAKQRRYTGLELNPETEVVVACGATGAFYAACLALLDAGDEALLFEPYYGYHVSTLASLGVTPVYVRLDPPDWSLDLDALERAVTNRTRVLILNTPGNPCGKVFSREELTRLGEFATAHDLFIFTDEIYEHFVYDGREHVCPAALPGLRERVITIGGVSKTFSITGWRLGYALGDERWTRTIGHFHDLVYVCAPAPLQMGVAKGLNELDSTYYEGLSGSLRRKRDRFCAALDKAGLPASPIQGAYYALADISRLPGRNSKERAMYLLERTGIACVPGMAFYHDDAGERLGRFSFAKEDDVIAEACRRLEAGGF